MGNVDLEILSSFIDNELARVRNDATGKTVYVGYFNTDEEGARAVNRKCRELRQRLKHPELENGPLPKAEDIISSFDIEFSKS